MVFVNSTWSGRGKIEAFTHKPGLAQPGVTKFDQMWSCLQQKWRPNVITKVMTKCAFVSNKIRSKIRHEVMRKWRKRWQNFELCIKTQWKMLIFFVIWTIFFCHSGREILSKKFVNGFCRRILKFCHAFLSCTISCHFQFCHVVKCFLSFCRASLPESNLYPGGEYQISSMQRQYHNHNLESLVFKKFGQPPEFCT